ncbi:Hypothetical protein SCF082_LOCUS46712 [Durusdinium trenchii]|uniref:RNA-editing substrate-binding complex 6 protein domain-containing protein n=1 Tax=Durusdinium trenchii TaxID=1381693 RepID=A0ABP0RKI3_9DINO
MLRSRRWSAVTLTVRGRGRGFSNEGGSPFGRNWAAGILETSPPPKLAERPRRRGVGLPNRLLGALALLRDPRELDSEGLGKAATAAAREGLEEDAWWQGFTERTKDIVDTLAMHDVSLILNGMARARRLDKDLVALLIPRICSNLVYLTSAHLAMLSSSIAKAEVNSPQFSSLLTRELKARLMEFHSPMELTMIINAASKLRISDEELYHRFVTHIQSRMGTEAFHVRDISVIVTALARVNCVDAKTMSRFCDGVVPTLPEATPLELARLMYACMSVSCHAHDLFTACVLHNREKASSMDPTALSNAAYAFGQCFEVAEVSHLRYLQKIFRHLRLASVASLPLFLPREIVGLLKTYARWQITFDCGQLCKVADRMLACKKHFDMETTVNGLHCLALLMQRNAVRGESGSSQAAWEAVSRAAGALLIPVWSGVQNELDVASILKAVEAAVVLQADGTALQSAVRQLLLLRPKDLDAPACLALQEQLSLMGVHPEEDLMLALADMRGDVTLYSY